MHREFGSGVCATHKNLTHLIAEPLMQRIMVGSLMPHHRKLQGPDFERHSLGQNGQPVSKVAAQ